MSGAKTIYPKRVVFLGTPWHKKGTIQSEPNTEKVVVSESVPANMKALLFLAHTSCFQDGTMKVYVAGADVGIARTSPGNENASFPWTRPIEVASGVTIEIKFEALDGTPSSEVNSYWDAALIPE